MSRPSMHSAPSISPPSILHLPPSGLPVVFLSPSSMCVCVCMNVFVCECVYGELGVGLGGNVIRLERLILLRWECIGRNREGDRKKRDGWRWELKCARGRGKKWMERQRSGRHKAGDFSSLTLSCLHFPFISALVLLCSVIKSFYLLHHFFLSPTS